MFPNLVLASTQAGTTCGDPEIGLRVNGERMRKWRERGNEERMRKWRERGNGERMRTWRE